MKRPGRFGHNRDMMLDKKMQIWDLRAKGLTQTTIAKQLDISQFVVSKYLKEARDIYHDLYCNEIKQTITEQVAFHESVAEEAMLAWEKSKSSLSEEGKKSPKKVIKRGGKGETSQISEFQENQGNHHYLDTAMTAKEKIRKIMGANEPEKVKVETNVTQSISIERATEELLAIIGSGETETVITESSDDKDGA